MMKRVSWILIAVALAAGLFHYESMLICAAEYHLGTPKSTAERLQEYGAVVADRLRPDFTKAGVTYPPKQITLVILKQERRVELYAADDSSQGFRFIRAYPILAASGHAGPKLQEGDEQVPEGIYAVDSLNPNSHYHLALHVNYPNAFDRRQAQSEKRTNLGGDIMIHGSDVSIGCVALGNPAAEDVFILAATTGIGNVRLLFCPFDFRIHAEIPLGGQPSWTAELYSGLKASLDRLPLPPPGA